MRGGMQSRHQCDKHVRDFGEYVFQSRQRQCRKGETECKAQDGFISVGPDREQAFGLARRDAAHGDQRQNGTAISVDRDLKGCD